MIGQSRKNSDLLVLSKNGLTSRRGALAPVQAVAPAPAQARESGRHALPLYARIYTRGQRRA